MRFASAFYRGRCRALLQPSSWRLNTPPLAFSRPNRPRSRLRQYSTSDEASSSAGPATALRYPDPPSTEHHDLASYAAYAARTGLDTASNTYVGTVYEYVVAASLRRLGLDLRRVGGRSDCGIDLLGTWALPSAAHSASSSPTPPLRILLQCKAAGARSSRVGPHYIRELEGAFAGAPAGWRGTSGVLGLLAAQKPATKGIRDALGRSRWPMGYVSCAADGRLEQLLWNRRAEEEGLEGLGIGVRYYTPPHLPTSVSASPRHADNDGQPEQELILTWKGAPYLPGEGGASGAAVGGVADGVSGLSSA